MKRVARAIEILAWALFFAVAALVLAVRFWLLPDIERHRGRIVEAISAAVGQPVRIGGIRAGWFGLNPHIHLRDVRVYDHAGREALALPAIENRLAWSSLVRGELRIHSFVIEGLRVQVRRDADGVLHIAGMKSTGDPRFTRWLLAQEEIVLRDAEIEWHDERRGAPPLKLSALNLRLRNSGNEHSLGLSARPPAALGSTLELRALLEGNELADPAAWKGRVYAELGDTELAAWRAWVDHPWQLDAGRGALRAWLTLEAGEVRQATADFALSGVAARLGGGLASLKLASAQGRLQGTAENGRYELRARELALTLDDDGGSIGPSDFKLSWASAQDTQGVFSATAVDFAALARLAASLPLPEDARKRLTEMKPKGRLAEARFEWRGPPSAPTGFAARAKFVDLAVAPSAGFPGLARISGSFDADEMGARIVLATRKGEIQLPKVFPEPRIALDFLSGLIEWERHGGSEFSLRLASLTFSNAHFSGNAHGRYTSAAAGPGSIDLSAQFNRADAAHLARYLPHAPLMGGEETRDWLMRGILGAHSGDVRVRVRGDLREFPFADASRGDFSVSARLEGGVLHYAQGWPRIDDIQGELVFERSRMQLLARSARIQGVALANVEASIPRIGANGELHVNGEVSGATAEFLKFIQETPVRRMTAGLTDAISAGGEGKLRLKLEIPLNDPPKTRVAGEYEFAGNDLILHAQLPPVEGASGKLRFTESTLTVSDAEGRLFGGRVAINGASQPDGRIQILAKGEATLAGTRALFDHPWRPYLSGQALYAATIHLGKGRAHVVVHSTLQGVASRLPAPLSKKEQEALPLQLELEPDERVKLKLGRILAAEFARNRKGVALGAAAEAPARLPESPGTLVYGALPSVDLDKWLPLFEAPDAPVEAAFDIRIGALDLYGKRLNQVALRAAADAGGWSATLASEEIAGELSYRKDAGGRLVARLARFRTPEAYPGAQARGTLEPKDLPSMDLTAERFNWRGKDLGRVEIRGQRAGDDWRIERLAMANAEASLAASGMWRRGSPSRSHLDFELTAADGGEFLGRVGYPNLVKGAKAQLKGSLAWNGDPGEIDYPSLAGAVQLEAQNGQFLEIEPGFGKLISLMSLQSLPRRIALDFRDVFSKGFDFERISSSGQIQAGLMHVKDFRMRGSSAQVEMSGELDLAHETQNMRVRVIPSVGDSAATVIGLVNPLLAIPAAIAQKILKDPLGHIFAFDYAVTGGWSDPKVAKLGIEAREAREAGSP